MTFTETVEQHEGKARKVLCVCTAGRLRSPTAANTLHRVFGFNTRSAGCNPKYALVEVTPKLLEWADEVVFFESCHYHLLEDQFGEAFTNKPSVLFNLPDEYDYGDPVLTRLVEFCYREYALTGAHAIYPH